MTFSESQSKPDWWDELSHLPESFRLIPCDGTKRPTDPISGLPLNNWTDKGMCAHEFNQLPRTYVHAAGLLLGPTSGGILAIDFDAEGHEKVFKEVFFGKHIYDLPKTVSWSSGKDGRRQMAYQVPIGEWEKIRNRCSWKNHNGETALELRWRGCQSIILGSHPETSGYRWCKDLSPRNISIAKAPDWLLKPLRIQQLDKHSYHGEGEPNEINLAKELLQVIRPRNEYDDWLKVGMALHSVDTSLLIDWIEWSRRTDYFDESECIDKWESFKSSGITLGTLRHMARQDNGGQTINEVTDQGFLDGVRSSREKLTETTIKEALAELVSLHSELNLNAKELIPPYLVNSLSIIRATVKYNWDVLLVTLMVGISGALPLESQVELIAGDFNQSLSLLAILLMDTGEVKSPLIKRLISDPWQKSVEILMKQRYLESLRYWKQIKEESLEGEEQFDVPRPEPVNTLITEDFTTQGLERHLVLHARYAKGSLLLLFDEGKDLLSEMSGQTVTTTQLKLGTWILSRYDGTGAKGAKADATKERSYSNCRLSAFICCQPDIYRQITGDADQSGLAGRFIVVEQATVEQEFPEEFDASHQQRHKELSKLLASLYTYVCDRSSLYLTLSDQSRRILQKERRSLADQKQRTLSAAARAQLNKAHGRLGRLAAILHILWAFDPANPEGREMSTVIDTGSMERAIILNRHLLCSSILARQTSAGNGESMQKIQAFHRQALKLSQCEKVSKIRKNLQSGMRATIDETKSIVEALDGIGVGKLTYDQEGVAWYQAIKPIA